MPAEMHSSRSLRVRTKTLTRPLRFNNLVMFGDVVEVVSQAGLDGP